MLGRTHGGGPCGLLRRIAMAHPNPGSFTERKHCVSTDLRVCILNCFFCNK